MSDTIHAPRLPAFSTPVHILRFHWLALNVYPCFGVITHFVRTRKLSKSVSLARLAPHLTTLTQIARALWIVWSYVAPGLDRQSNSFLFLYIAMPSFCDLSAVTRDSRVIVFERLSRFGVQTASHKPRTRKNKLGNSCQRQHLNPIKRRVLLRKPFSSCSNTSRYSMLGWLWISRFPSRVTRSSLGQILLCGLAIESS